MAGRRDNSRGRSRTALRSLTGSEANKTNRKRRSRNGSNATKTLQKQRKKKKKNARSTAPLLQVIESSNTKSAAQKEVVRDPFITDDIVTEPPTKKRRLSPRSELPHDHLPSADDTLLTNPSPMPSNHNNHAVPSRAALYPSGTMTTLRKDRRRIIRPEDDTIVQLKATNKELSTRNTNHRRQYKKWQKKLKQAMHQNDCKSKLLYSLHQRDQRFKTERMRHLDAISELEMKNEKLTAELNRNMKADREQSVDVVMEDKSERVGDLKQQIKDLQYESSRWKLKYNKLLQQSNQVLTPQSTRYSVPVHVDRVFL